MKISYSSVAYGVLSYICSFFSSVKWPRIQAWLNGGLYYSLKEIDHDKLRTMLKPNYYFILTRRKCHLTTYLISLASFLATGRWSYYSHVLMNVDNGNAANDGEYKFIEATNPGVHFSTFMEIFDCDSVALLKPCGIINSDWVLILDKALEQQGKKYDDLFDLLDDTHVSCVELCRDALMALPNYETRFAKFETLINKHGKQLTPQMFYDCGDFELILEIKR
jgi:hypothetical protein